MKRFSMLLSAFIIFGILASTTGCTSSYSDNHDPSIRISVAMSLVPVMEEITVAFHKAHPELTIQLNYGSSGSLSQQIDKGADVDIFFSASSYHMDQLEEKEMLLPSSRKNVLENRIVLIAPKGEEGLRDFKGLAGDGVTQIGIGELESVPAGRYAGEVLESSDLMTDLEEKLIYGKDVRQVLTWVESGNVDAGFVYYTDALASDKVRIVETAPKNTHRPVHYPIALLKDSEKIREAKTFLSFLGEDAARKIFKDYGFTITQP